jgi:TolB-like protein
MAEFFAELKRRQMFRVAAAYAVVAWLLLQIVNNVAPVLDLPVWVARAFLLALVIGFPIALLFVWMRDLAPADGASPRLATTRLDYILAGALVIVIALLSYQQLAPPLAPGTARQASVAALPSAGAQAGGISIAVLPFANVSDDAGQEFFSDGMTDEIMTALAKIPDLRVVARASAFQFKGQNRDIQAISQALNARYVIDGSVRKAGTRVRIAAQLIQADNGLNVWAESFDRELTDVFAIQEDIAQAIAGALRVPLGLQQGQTLVSNRTNDIESYQQYLRAKALVRARGTTGLSSLTSAVTLLGQVVARDSNFAPAWALLAYAHALTPGFHPASLNGAVNEFRRIVDDSRVSAETAARKAIDLDPNQADGYVALGTMRLQHGELTAAEDLYSKALAIDASNPDAPNQYSILLAGVGRLKEALAMRRELLALEPFVPIFKTRLSNSLWLNGDDEAAIAMLMDLPGNGRAADLARIYASVDRFADAAAAIREITPETYIAGAVDSAARLLESASTTTASPQGLPNLGRLGFVYLYAGAPNRVIESYKEAADEGYWFVGPTLLWHHSYAAVRKTNDFKTYLRAAGLVDYWRAKGWPEFCRPIGADDFECD